MKKMIIFVCSNTHLYVFLQMIPNYEKLIYQAPFSLHFYKICIYKCKWRRVLVPDVSAGAFGWTICPGFHHSTKYLKTGNEFQLSHWRPFVRCPEIPYRKCQKMQGNVDRLRSPIPPFLNFRTSMYLSILFTS